MPELPKNRPTSRDVRTSLVDDGWSDIPPEVDDESTVQVSRDELDRMVEGHTSERAAPRELPRYEMSEEGGSESDRLRHDDATKRIAYAALLGGSQAGKGGPRAVADQVHEQPTLVGQPRLSEEAARQLAQAAPRAEAPLPSFADEQEPSLGDPAFEQAAESFEPEFAFVPGVEPPERELLAQQMPAPPEPPGFDDSDLTVPFAVPMPPEMFPDTPSAAPPEPSPALAEPPKVASPTVPPAPPEVPAKPAPPTPVVATHAFEPAAAPPADPPGAVLRTPAEFGQTVSSGPALVEHSDGMRPSSVELSTALGQRFRFAGIELPVWLLWIVPTLIAGAALLAALRTPSNEATIAAHDASEPASPPSAEPPAEAASNVRERAARGEAEALNRLLAVPGADRSVADEVAIAKARTARELVQLQELAQRVERDQALARSDETKQRLLQYVNDPRTAPDALAIISSLPAPIGADLLYEIWTGTKQSNDVTQLAKELVYKRSIVANASEALKVALELRAEPSCEAIPALLPRAEEFGDWRSLHLLGKLLVRRGCGKGKRQDCYPCLRTPATEERIEAAIKAVRARPRPKL